MIIATLYMAAVSVANCRVVTDDVIRMRDLAAVAPAFSAMDEDSVVAYSPLPGSVRILQGAELVRLARRHGIADGEFSNVCFQRAMRQLGEQELIGAFRQSLGIPGAQVELVDFSRFPTPVGDLVFPRSGLSLSPSTGSSFWKGYVIYGNDRHFTVWARVKVRAKLNRVVATDNLVTTRPVRADQVRIEPLEGVPDALAPAQSLDQVVGKNLLRPIARGATVSLDDISTAISVRRGDKVDIDFRSPLVHLRFEAIAEMDGRFGDYIRLRNLQSNSTFVAEVSGKDQARVVPAIENTEKTNDDSSQEHHSSGSPDGPDVLPCRSSAEKEEGCR